MPYQIRFEDIVHDELREIRPFDRKIILDRIDAELQHEPTVETRNRKPLPGLNPTWEHLEPIWELRVGDFRVYYDVNEEMREVVVRAIRKKPPHTTTEESLS